MPRTGGSRGRPNKPIGKGTLPLPKDITLEDLQDIPAPPEHLQEDGCIMWYKLLAYGKAWIHPADRMLVAEACELFEEKEFLRRSIALNDLRVYVYKGQKLPHPYIAQQRQARQDFHTKLAALGFTPSDRARMHLELLAEETDDIFTALNNLRLERERATNAALGVEPSADEDDFAEDLDGDQ